MSRPPHRAEMDACDAFHNMTCRLDHTDQCGYLYGSWTADPYEPGAINHKIAMLRLLRDGSLTSRAEGLFTKADEAKIKWEAWLAADPNRAHGGT